MAPATFRGEEKRQSAGGIDYAIPCHGRGIERAARRKKARGDVYVLGIRDVVVISHGCFDRCGVYLSPEAVATTLDALYAIVIRQHTCLPNADGCYRVCYAQVGYRHAAVIFASVPRQQCGASNGEVWVCVGRWETACGALCRGVVRVNCNAQNARR